MAETWDRLPRRAVPGHDRAGGDLGIGCRNDCFKVSADLLHHAAKLAAEAKDSSRDRALDRLGRSHVDRSCADRRHDAVVDQRDQHRVQQADLRRRRHLSEDVQVNHLRKADFADQVVDQALAADGRPFFIEGRDAGNEWLGAHDGCPESGRATLWIALVRTIASTSAASNPSSRRTSSLCSPRVGGARSPAWRSPS